MVEAIFLSFEGVKRDGICTPKMDGDLPSNIFFFNDRTIQVFLPCTVCINSPTRGNAGPM